MSGTFAEQKTVPAVFDAVHHILDDHAVSQIILSDLIIILTDSGCFTAIVKLKARAGESGNQNVFEGPLFSLLLRVHMIADTAEIHVKNRMMPVLPFGRCGQTVNMLRGDIFQHLLKADRRDVVAFIYDDYAVFSEPRFDFVGITHRLQHGDIDNAAAGIFIGSIQADDFPLFLSPLHLG